MLIQRVEKICEDTAKLDGYNIKVRRQQGMDLVLGEMSSDSRKQDLHVLEGSTALKSCFKSIDQRKTNSVRVRESSETLPMPHEDQKDWNRSRRTTLMKLAKMYRGSTSNSYCVISSTPKSNGVSPQTESKHS
mmetsp:Transcript_30645/g.49164  ORF Transcript_30645/g.49164 Transcript_30645/m.49164 type:complete len:133 (-) Transcript_30645:73-471(-)